MPERAPYGAWYSPISASDVARSARRPGDVSVDGLDVYVNESRPEEGGRGIVVKIPLGGDDPGQNAVEFLPREFSVQSRVHEYGGGAFSVKSGVVVLSNDTDQALYLFGPTQYARRLSPKSSIADRRFAEPLLDLNRERVLCVVEEHTRAGHGERREPMHYIAAIGYGSRTGRVETLISGQDFYSSLRLSPDGRRLAWLSWRHPHMPWEESELWVAELDARGLLRAPARIAGGPGESVFQPEWDRHGGLLFVSDKSGFWNLYRWDREHTRPLCPKNADFGAPQWAFGMSTYCLLPSGDLLCTYSENGTWHLARLSRDSGRLEPIESPYTEFSELKAGADGAVLLCASPQHGTRLMHWSEQGERFVELRRFADDSFESSPLSQPEPIEFPTSGGGSAYGLYYPPLNPEFEGLPGERPPLLVHVHGGPTAQASTALNLRTQFWTSRGFAVLDVNYRGSSGYGREYREALKGKWGLADIDDCIAGATFLVQRGLVDSRRLCIRGGSAGGYTALAALTFHDVFAAGAVYYGISDLSALARDTHKFESRYLDSLVGPYATARERYLERSPLVHANRLKRPVVFFHGLEDKVTPPNQATVIVDSLRQRGVPVAYVEFAGEGHGFRQAETLRRSLEGELYFYSQVFEFEPADRLDPLPIENLQTSYDDE
jgi:dipeptidyl aminopeptidase/acylaminoacyl peptidase